MAGYGLDPHLPESTPAETAVKLLAVHDVAAVDACAVEVMTATRTGDDVAMYYWLRVISEVVKRLIAEREELGG